jgi:creatinine amidohydrolase
MSKMTYFDFKSKIRENSNLILPIGTLEAHGPHLPMSTDTICAEGIAQRLGKELDFTVAPAVQYGITNSLFGYPGSVRISPDSFASYIRDIITSFLGHGISRIIIINGHGGNTSTLEALCKDITDEYIRMRERIQIVLIDWWRVSYPFTEEYYGVTGGHAAIDETAVVLALKPESVKIFENIDSLKSTIISDGVRAYPVEAPILLYEESGGLPDFNKEKSRLFFEKLISKLKLVILNLIKCSDHNL